MISGRHVVIYSTDADADRTFFREVLKLPNVEVGPKGWLIFGLPPAEVAVHPSDQNCVHGISCDDVHEEGWGRVSSMTLPGGGKLRVYEPRHERP